LETCDDITTSQIPQILGPFVDVLIHALYNLLQHAENNVVICRQKEIAAFDALQAWAAYTRHVTLSKMLAPCPILPLMVLRLSDVEPQDQAASLHLQAACKALTEAIQTPSDIGSSERSDAASALIASIASTGFIARPLEHASGNDDDLCFELSTLFIALITEQMDDLVCAEAPVLIVKILLQLQQHPCNKVRMMVLDFWLAVHDIPTAERHHDWKYSPVAANGASLPASQLWPTVVQTLVSSTRYPLSMFTATSDDDDDWTELEEYRTLTSDVYASCYYLLRSDMIEYLAQLVTSGSNERRRMDHNQASEEFLVAEAALFSLTAVAKDVISRICPERQVRQGASSLVDKDRQKTTSLLLDLIRNVCQRPPPDHALVLPPLYQIALARFVGAYAILWVSACSPHDLYSLMEFLVRLALPTLNDSVSNLPGSRTRDSSGSFPVHDIIAAAASGIRALLIRSPPDKIFLTPEAATEQKCILNFLDGIFQPEALETALEGCTRICVATITHSEVRAEQLFMIAVSQHRFLSDVVDRLYLRGTAAVATVGLGTHSDEAEARQARFHDIVLTLRGFQTMIRFCECEIVLSSGSGWPELPIQTVMNRIHPFLETVMQRVSSEFEVLCHVVSIHEQLVRSFPSIVAPRLKAVVYDMVRFYGHAFAPVVLTYIGNVVEAIGQSETAFLAEVLTHVTRVTFEHLSAVGDLKEHTDLISGFFDMAQRYLIHASEALLHSRLSREIVARGVEYLQICQYEHTSSQSIFLFVGQICGWRTLWLSDVSKQALASASKELDEISHHEGGILVRACIAALLSGPQSVRSSSADCLFAIISALLSGPQSVRSSSADCLFAIISATAKGPVSSDRNVGLAHLYLVEAYDWHKKEHPQTAKQDIVFGQVIEILVALAMKEPNKNKDTGKLLLNDFTRIIRGEETVDVLATYRV
jgi:hypothetical protein